MKIFASILSFEESRFDVVFLYFENRDLHRDIVILKTKDLETLIKVPDCLCAKLPKGRSEKCFSQ